MVDYLTIDYKADATLDCKGLLCPMPIVKLGKQMKTMQPGQTLEILATDIGVESDIPAWCQSTKNEYIGMKEPKEGLYTLYIRKA
ncbi:MAG: sulfurtransferase TusA family protein [Nanoarchaeota archaeon]|nr:sulfurtransferase TusA family protein [Nanoarchaeota archaeon]